MSYADTLAESHSVNTTQHGGLPEPPTATSALWRYGVACLTVALALLLRGTLTPWWNDKFPFVTLYPAVLLSAWYGGIGPGIVASLIGAAGATYAWVVPFGSLGIHSPSDQLGLGLTVVNLVLIAWLTTALQRAQAHAEQRVQERTAVLQAEVAAHQRAEEKLRLQAQMLDMLAEGVGVVEWDNTLVYTNPAFDAMFGYARGELWGKDGMVLNDYTPEEHAQFVEQVQRSLRQQGVWRGEIRNRRKDGTSFTTATRTALLEHGEHRYWVGVQEDITGRKQMEEELHAFNVELEQRVRERTVALERLNGELQREITARQQAEQGVRERVEELETLLDLLPVSVWQAHDPTCTHITGNRAGYEMLRLPIGTNVSLSTSEAERPTNYYMYRTDGTEVAPEDFPMQYAATHEVPVPPSEFLLRFSDGEERYVYGSAKPLFDLQGYIRGSLGVFMDITTRKQAEIALQQSEERFRRSFEDSALPMALVALDGRYLRVNRAYCTTMGYSADEFLTFSVEDLVVPEDQGLARELNREVLSGKREQYHIERRYRRKDGTIAWLLGNATLLRDTAGQPLYFIAQGQDITDRKRAEEAVAQHARDLAHAHADLRQVAYVSAHDLQEPIRQIGIYTQRISQQYGDTMDVELRDAVTYIIEGTRRMQAQFTDLMHYLEMDNPGEGVTTTDCEKVLQQALNALSEAIVASGAAVTYDPLPTIEVNAKHLQMVLQELIDNAVKFRSSVPPQVHIAAAREAHAWRFAVRDNGIGIASTGREQLFGFFRKLHQRQEYPGTGMGLAICKKIVERHGGRIWIDSAVGEGTTIYFTIDDQVKGGL